MPVCVRKGPSGRGSAEDLCSGTWARLGRFPLVWPYSAGTCLEHCLPAPLSAAFLGTVLSCECAGVIPTGLSLPSSGGTDCGPRFGRGRPGLGRVPGCTRQQGQRVGWPHHLPLPSCCLLPQTPPPVMFSNKNFFHSVGP